MVISERNNDKCILPLYMDLVVANEEYYTKSVSLRWHCPLPLKLTTRTRLKAFGGRITFPKFNGTMLLDDRDSDG